MDRYQITKILSNNVLLVKNDKNRYVLVGKGLGFGKAKGDILENTEAIEQKFISLGSLVDFEYENFLESVDPKIIEICKKINEMIKKEIGEDFSEKINVGLIDHINFAVKRLKEGVDIVNPFLYETRLLYPVEYELAKKAVVIIENDLGISIPDSEIGFLTLHFFGGRGSNDKNKALEHTKLINIIISFVEKKFEIKINRTSFDFKRFLMHLSGLIDRLENKSISRDSLALQIKEQIPVEYKAAYDISKIIEKSLKLKMVEPEITYTAIHLHKLKEKKEN